MAPAPPMDAGAAKVEQPLVKRTLHPLEVWRLCSQRFANADPHDIVQQVGGILVDGPAFEVQCALAAGLRREILKSVDVASQMFRPLSGDESNYRRELWWIASGTLYQALQRGAADTERLGRLLLHPEAMAMARKLMLRPEDTFHWDADDTTQESTDVETAFRAIVARSQSEAWNWLRDQVLAGQLQPFAGKSVAVWKKDQRLEDFIVADNLIDAGRQAYKQWMLPKEMIAVTQISNLEGESECFR